MISFFCPALSPPIFIRHPQQLRVRTFHLQTWVWDCSHLSASVMVSSCLDKDLQLRLISMPPMGSRPLFLFSCSLSLGLDGGGVGEWKVCEWKRERKCVFLYVEGWEWVKCPPGICFALVMRSWVLTGGLSVCELENTACICTQNTRTWLNDKYYSCITRGQTIFSWILAAIVQHSLT